MNTARRLRRPFFLLAFVAAALAFSAADAQASHFRYGSISWSVPNPAQPNVVRIRFDAAWRRDYDSWTTPGGVPVTNPGIGAVITSPSSARPGSNYVIQVFNAANALVQEIPLILTVTGADVTQDIITTSFEINLNPLAAGSYRVQFDDCCRLSTLLGSNNDVAFFVTAGVTLVVPANRQPVAATLPIISVQHNNAAASFTIPGFDPDGDKLTYSIPTTAQSGLNQLVPPGLTINPATGVVTWDTRPPAVVLNGLYAAQFRVTDGRGAYTSIDVLLRPVTAAGQAPTVRINGQATNQVFNVVRQTPFSFTVNGQDPEVAPVTMQSSPLPIGATMTPSLPTSMPNGVVNSTFNWTPSSSQIGTFAINYAVTDGSGQQSSRTATINVTNRPPAVMCTSSGGTIEATGPTGATFSITAALADLDNDRLTYRLLIDGSLKTTLTNQVPSISVPQSTVVALGSHSYEVQVFDGFTEVNCTGNFSIVDTTAPTLHLPADIFLVANGINGAMPDFSVTATDTVDTSPIVNCDPPSGAIFPIYPVGTTTVTCTAIDDYSNQNTGTFTVTVTPAATSFEALMVAPNGLVGAPINVNTTLTRTSAPAGRVTGALVRFILTGPSPSTDTMFVPSFTNHEGHAFAAFTPSERGIYTVTAYYDGDLGLQPASAGPATVTVFQRTRLFVNTANGTAGEALIQFAELIPVPPGPALSGRPVNLSFAGPGAPPPVDVVTDANGRAETHATFTVADTHTITATFFAADFMTDAAGTIPPVPTTAQGEVIVRPVIAVFDNLIVVDTFALVGNSYSVQTSLRRSSVPAGPLGGRPVALTLTAPSGVTTTQALITTASGFVNAVFPLIERGNHTLVATYAGDAATAAASSNTVSIQVYQRVMLTVPPVIGTAGAEVSLNATATLLPQNQPLVGQPVTFSSNGIQPNPLSAPTDGTGAARVTGIYAGQGEYTVTAVFDGTADFFTNRSGAFALAETESAFATISAASSSITLNSPSASLVAEQLNVSATLTRTAAPAGAVGNALVQFTLTGPSPSTAATTLFAQTDAVGNATMTFAPTERGSYSVSVRFQGDSALAASTSAPATVGVYQRARLTLAPVNGGPNSLLSVVATLVALPQNSGLSNQDVQFSFGGVVAPQTAQTSVSGAATVLVTFPSVGSFGAHATFSNPANFLTDAAGSIPPAPATADAPVTISDSSPPVITPTITGVLGPNDWYTSNVNVSWNVADPEGGIQSSSGCSSSTTSTDGALFSFTCTAASAGGSSTRTVTFKRDATAPTLNLPASFTVPATTSAGALVNYVATPSDATSGVATFNCAPASGAQFAIATTTVSCTVTDTAGHATAGSFAVTVRDTIPPAIANVRRSSDSLWPPDHRMVPITLSVSATDNLGPAPVCAITGITSDEPENGQGDGDTPNDWLITGALTAQLRAERAGGGDGRVYTLAVRCVDQGGNTATSSTAVAVPKSQKY